MAAAQTAAPSCRKKLYNCPMTSQDCIFCQIAAGMSPASIVYADERIAAFMDINQPVPYKTLIIPRAHVETIYDLSGEQAAWVMQAAVQIAQAIRAASNCDGLMLSQSNGAAAGQEVFHFHLHLWPRFWGDRLRISVPRSLTPRAELDRMASEIRARLDF